MDYAQVLKKTYRNSLVLYIAFMVSLFIYLIVFEVLKSHISEFQGMMEKIDFPWLRYAFYALGLVQVFFIKFISDTAAKSTAAVDIQNFIQHLQKVSVISASLCEVPALLGWVLFFLSGVSRDFYILLSMSFVLFVVYFPRYSNWEMWVRSKVNHK